VALEEEALALVALGLLLEHPLGEGLGLLAKRVLLLLGVLGLGFLLHEGGVLLGGEASRNVGTLVLLDKNMHSADFHNY
jgi:hypothetical protein